MPISLWLFVLTAVLFLLQLFPYTGIFLMLVAAPVWSIATINLGFMCMTLEALIGRIPRWLVLVPLAYIVLYLIAADRDQRELAQLRQEIARQNDVAELPFDQNQHDLVIASTSHGTLNPLITNYGLRVGFEMNRNGDRTSHRAHRLADQATCTRMREMPELMASGIQVYNIREGTRRFNKEICRVIQPLDPVKPAVVITMRETRRTGASMPVTFIDTTIQGPGDEVRKLRAGHAQPLMPWPMPAMGCGLNSGAPSWDCFAQFMRGRSPLLVGENGEGDTLTSVIAKVLRLVPTPIAEMKPDAVTVAALEQQSETIRQSQQDDELARLDTLIAAPTEYRKNSGFYRFPLLSKRIDLVVPRAPQLVEALGQAMSVIGGRDAAQAMAQLVANLPAETFRNHGLRIAAHLALEAPEHPAARHRQRDIERRKRDRPRYRMNALLTRSGDLGEAVLPMLLEDISPDMRRPDAAAILALCRMGAPMALTAGPRLTEILNTTTRTKNDGLHSAAFVTLLRLGLREAALADPDASATYQHKWYQQALDSITPDSPRSVCTTSHGRSPLPN